MGYYTCFGTRKLFMNLLSSKCWRTFRLVGSFLICCIEKSSPNANHPRLKWRGMNYFMRFLRGAHLLAHTCASRAVQHGAFFGLFSIEKASFFCNRNEIIAHKCAFVDKSKRFFSKMWYCLPIEAVILLLLLQKELSAFNGQLLMLSALISEDWDVF